MEVKKPDITTKEGKQEYINALRLIVNERLIVGQVIPSYSKLCKILGELPQKANSKKAQFKLWESCFSFEKGVGNKMVITDIYEEPKPIVDNRDGNGGEFLKYTLPLMLGFLSKHNGQISITRTQLMKELYFFNERWSGLYEGSEQSEVLKEYRDDGISVGNIWDLYDAAGASFKRTIEEVLNYMGRGNYNSKRRKFMGMELINLEIGYVFAKKVIVLRSEKDNYTSKEYDKSMWLCIPDNEKSMYTERISHYESTKEDMDTVMGIKRSLMTEAGKESQKDIRGRQANFKFQRDFEDAVQDTFNCEYFYEKYNITYDKTQVDNLLKIGNYKQLQTEFNEKIAINQSINAHNRKIRAVAMINSERYEHLLSISNSPEDKLAELMRGGELTAMEKKLIARIKPQFLTLNDKLINDRILVKGDIEEVRDRYGVVFIDENYNLLNDPDNGIDEILLDYAE